VQVAVLCKPLDQRRGGVTGSERREEADVSMTSTDG
jgi:hypothetical protein